MKGKGVTTGRQRAKGDILLRVLECIAGGVVDVALLFETFLEAGYGASYGKMEYTRERLRAEHLTRVSERRVEGMARANYQKFLSRIRKDGLIETRGTRGIFSITKRGRDKLAALRERKQRMLPSVRRYDAEVADVFTIVTFDVPERFKSKREWLRAVLRELGFTFVQKSVWLGKVKLPWDFLEDIRSLELSEYIEIFQITKRGTLRRLE